MAGLELFVHYEFHREKGNKLVHQGKTEERGVEGRNRYTIPGKGMGLPQKSAVSLISACSGSSIAYAVTVQAWP